MERATVTAQELHENYNSGFITADFTLKELVQDAIICETYYETVDIIVVNCNYEECKVQVKIQDFLSPSEHSEVLKLNGYE